MLQMLYGIFDQVLRGALELIESNSVTIMQINNCFTKTDQFIFQVIKRTSFNLISYIQYPQFM